MKAAFQFNFTLVPKPFQCVHMTNRMRKGKLALKLVRSCLVQLSWLIICTCVFCGNFTASRAENFRFQDFRQPRSLSKLDSGEYRSLDFHWYQKDQRQYAPAAANLFWSQEADSKAFPKRRTVPNNHRVENEVLRRSKERVTSDRRRDVVERLLALRSAEQASFDRKQLFGLISTDEKVSLRNDLASVRRNGVSPREALRVDLKRERAVRKEFRRFDGDSQRNDMLISDSFSKNERRTENENQDRQKNHDGSLNRRGIDKRENRILIRSEESPNQSLDRRVSQRRDYLNIDSIRREQRSSDQLNAGVVFNRIKSLSRAATTSRLQKRSTDHSVTRRELRKENIIYDSSVSSRRDRSTSEQIPDRRAHQRLQKSLIRDNEKLYRVQKDTHATADLSVDRTESQRMEKSNIDQRENLINDPASSRRAYITRGEYLRPGKVYSRKNTFNIDGQLDRQVFVRRDDLTLQDRRSYDQSVHRREYDWQRNLMNQKFEDSTANQRALEKRENQKQNVDYFRQEQPSSDRRGIERRGALLGSSVFSLRERKLADRFTDRQVFGRRDSLMRNSASFPPESRATDRLSDREVSVRQQGLLRATQFSLREQRADDKSDGRYMSYKRDILKHNDASSRREPISYDQSTDRLMVVTRNGLMRDAKSLQREQRVNDRSADRQSSSRRVNMMRDVNERFLDKEVYNRRENLIRDSSFFPRERRSNDRSLDQQVSNRRDSWMRDGLIRATSATLRERRSNARTSNQQLTKEQNDFMRDATSSFQERKANERSLDKEVYNRRENRIRDSSFSPRERRSNDRSSDQQVSNRRDGWMRDGLIRATSAILRERRSNAQTSNQQLTKEQNDFLRDATSSFQERKANERSLDKEVYSRRENLIRDSSFSPRERRSNDLSSDQQVSNRRDSGTRDGLIRATSASPRERRSNDRAANQQISRRDSWTRDGLIRATPATLRERRSNARTSNQQLTKEQNDFMRGAASSFQERKANERSLDKEVYNRRENLIRDSSFSPRERRSNDLSSDQQVSNRRDSGARDGLIRATSASLRERRSNDRPTNQQVFNRRDSWVRDDLTRTTSATLGERIASDRSSDHQISIWRENPILDSSFSLREGRASDQSFDELVNKRRVSLIRDTLSSIREKRSDGHRTNRRSLKTRENSMRNSVSSLQESRSPDQSTKIRSLERRENLRSEASLLPRELRSDDRSTQSRKLLNRENVLRETPHSYGERSLDDRSGYLRRLENQENWLPAAASIFTERRSDDQSAKRRLRERPDILIRNTKPSLQLQRSDDRRVSERHNSMRNTISYSRERSFDNRRVIEERDTLKRVLDTMPLLPERRSENVMSESRDLSQKRRYVDHYADGNRLLKSRDNLAHDVSSMRERGSKDRSANRRDLDRLENIMRDDLFSHRERDARDQSGSKRREECIRKRSERRSATSLTDKPAFERRDNFIPNSQFFSRAIKSSDRLENGQKAAKEIINLGTVATSQNIMRSEHRLSANSGSFMSERKSENRHFNPNLFDGMRQRGEIDWALIGSRFIERKSITSRQMSPRTSEVSSRVRVNRNSRDLNAAREDLARSAASKEHRSRRIEELKDRIASKVRNRHSSLVEKLEMEQTTRLKNIRNMILRRITVKAPALRQLPETNIVERLNRMSNLRRKERSLERGTDFDLNSLPSVNVQAFHQVGGEIRRSSRQRVLILPRDSYSLELNAYSAERLNENPTTAGFSGEAFKTYSSTLRKQSIEPSNLAKGLRVVRFEQRGAVIYQTPRQAKLQSLEYEEQERHLSTIDLNLWSRSKDVSLGGIPKFALTRMYKVSDFIGSFVSLFSHTLSDTLMTLMLGVKKLNPLLHTELLMSFLSYVLALTLFLGSMHDQRKNLLFQVSTNWPSIFQRCG